MYFLARFRAFEGTIHLIPAIGTLTLMFWSGSVVHAQPETPNANPPVQLPEIEVEAPPPSSETTTPPAPLEPSEVMSPLEAVEATIPSVSGILGQLTNAPFDFSGSPFGTFDSQTSLATGVPNDITNISRSMSILDQTRISQDQAGTVPQLLENLPGILIQRTNLGGGSLLIRGRNGNQNLIMIDGIPINDAAWRFGNNQYLNTIDPGVIERLEVLRGPASVLYGSGATGGVLNIVTKRRDDYSSNFGVNGGLTTNYGTAAHDIYNRASFNGNWGRLGITGGASYLGTGTLNGGQGIDYNNTDYDQVAADIRADYILDEYWTFTVAYQHFFQNDVPRTDRFPEPNPLSPPDNISFLTVNRPTYFDPQQRDFGYGRLTYYNPDAEYIHGMTLTFSGLQRREGERELDINRNPDRITNAYTEIDQWGFDLRAFSEITERNTLSYGVTYINDSIDATRVRANVGQPLVPIAPLVPDDGDQRQFGVFLMDQWQATEWLTLTAGVRYANGHADGTSLRGNQRILFNRNFDVWVSEFGAVVRLTDATSIYSNIAEGFRLPNLDDLASDDVATSAGQDFGAIGLSTERVWNYEVGVRNNFENLQTTGSVFQSDYGNLIARQVLPNGSNLRGNFEGVIRGAEVDSVLYLLPTWSLYGNMTYLWGENTSFNEPLRVPPVFFLAGQRFTFPRYRSYVDMWGEFSGKQTRLGAVDRADTRVPVGGERAWQTLNMRAGTDMGRWGELNVGLYNIADQAYRVLGSGLNAPGIDFRVGYNLSF